MKKSTAKTLLALAAAVGAVFGVQVAFDEKILDGCSDEPSSAPAESAGHLADDSDGGAP